jgi:hypothetical protein
MQNEKCKVQNAKVSSWLLLGVFLGGDNALSFAFFTH